eukprot:1917105-Lingulodinium_polyedra.AAC.1
MAGGWRRRRARTGGRRRLGLATEWCRTLAACPCQDSAEQHAPDHRRVALPGAHHSRHLSGEAWARGRALRAVLRHSGHGKRGDSATTGPGSA